MLLGILKKRMKSSFIGIYKGKWKYENLGRGLRYLISFFVLPVRKPAFYLDFRLSLNFFYALSTPFFVTGGVVCWNRRTAFASDSSVT